jgi:hypothetical protein
MIPYIFKCSRLSTFAIPTFRFHQFNLMRSFPHFETAAKDLGKSASHILLLLCRSLSAQSRSVFHCATMNDFVLYTTALYFSHLLPVSFQQAFVFH